MNRLGAGQHGVASRAQALASGVTSELVRSYLRRGQWQPLHRGIYATFSGPVPRMANIWAALLAAGDRAVVSHQTAAELVALTDDTGASVHVTIPADRRVHPIRGTVLHVSTRVDAARHRAGGRPRHASRKLRSTWPRRRHRRMPLLVG